MKRFKSILCTCLLTLAVSSSVFAGNITGKAGNITGSPSNVAGNITGRTFTDAISGIIMYLLIP